MQKFWLILIISLVTSYLRAQNVWILSGTVTDTSGTPVELVNVKIIDSNIGSITDISGKFRIVIKEKKEVVVIFSHINYSEKELSVSQKDKPISLNIVLTPKDKEISEIKITDKNAREKGLVEIEPILFDNIPNISGNQIQTFIKTLPGVASVNEMSSTYSVRGGNYDENLVYINGFEIFRPALLQSGQQEGLNMVNSDLAGKVDFSTGGYSALYDDKMSSVLDIHYKKPNEFKASTSISILGASAHLEGSHFKRKFSHLTGIRYKNSQYLLNSLETEGEYKPNFFDVQTSLNYELNNYLGINLLAYYASNNYLFFPEDRSTKFGTTNEALNLYIDFDGKEEDKFTSLMGGMSLEYSNSKNLNLKLNMAAHDNHESLTYDVLGRYSLNQLDNSIGSSTFGDSIMNLGIGSFLEHARSYYNARIYSFGHQGNFQAGKHYIQWGLKYQRELVDDRVNEWKMIDSAGYSIPSNVSELSLAEYWHSSNSLNSNRYSTYVQANYKNTGSINWNVEYGIRLSYWDINKEYLLSPRLSLGWYPKDNQRLFFRIGGGVYYQSIFYREIIERQGLIHKETKTPKSIQYIASVDYDFRKFERPLHFKAELYYKDLQHIIPYSVDNIRILYYPNKTAKGYVGGLDLRINGEFVPGTDSWLSVSLMKSGIDIAKDTIGYQALPNDHLVNISLFFQDYVPGNKRLKMYLALFYLTGLPFGPTNNQSYYAPLRMPDYKRVDMGFSVDLKSRQHRTESFFKNIVFHLEVFNLLGIANTISYNWVTVVPNSSVVGLNNFNSYAVPNRLSARRLNLRLLLEF